jgi:hypothetical protein
LASKIVSQEAAWLAEHAANNVMPPPAVMFSHSGVAQWQRFRENIRRVGERIVLLREHPHSTPELDRAVDKLFDEYFWAA